MMKLQIFNYIYCFSGFERDVPGYPRFRYSGRASEGEHYLIITGITLKDDGEYQCQVGPTARAPPIWVSANVTVMGELKLTNFCLTLI